MKTGKELTFAVDVDDTLRETIYEMVDLYNETFGTNITTSDVKSYDVDESFPLIKEKLGVNGFEFFFLENGERVFGNAKVIEKAKESLEKLREIGKVIIVTYQKTTINRQTTLAWLKKHDLQYDGICFLKDKSLITCDYFIDDYHENFIGSNCKHGILINKPYNADIPVEELIKKSNCKTIRRFNSIATFCNWLTSSRK